MKKEPCCSFSLVPLSTKCSLNKFQINPLLNDKFLDVTKLKAFAEDQLNVAKIMIFSSTGQRPPSYCHGVVSVCQSVRKLCLQKTFPQKLLTGFLPNVTGMFLLWSSFKFFRTILFHEELWLPWQPK